MSDPVPSPCCSFCDKSAADVRQLMTSGGAFICDECLGFSRKIVIERNDPVALAELRIAAFAALKGWGSAGPDGKWASWDMAQLKVQAESLVVWALSSRRPAPTPEAAV